MHNALRRAFIVLVAACLAVAFAPLSAPAQGGPPITVFAAASLQNALDEAGKLYTSKTGKQVRFSFAASSALARQIEQGAPTSLFVSADEEWMNYLSERRLVANASRVNLLTNKLALIAPATSNVRIAIGKNMPLAKALGANGRLSVAAPEVPAGRYAKAALTSLGVWDSVQSRTAPGESVRAALNFVARGETPLGIVYDTDAKVEPRVKIVGLFPTGSHPKIIYPAALVGSQTNADAAAFLYWLRGPEAGKVFAKYGFARP